MKKMAPTQLRKDLYQLLDQVLESGEGIEIVRPTGSVILLPQKKPGKLANLAKRQTVIGDVDDIDKITWEDSWRPDSI